jgi:hypothetical protein
MAIPANAATPCCTIAGLDTKNGLASGRETATGRTFQFKFGAAQLKALHVGSPIYANVAKKQASLDGALPCCSIVGISGGKRTPGFTPVDGVTGASAEPHPYDPVDGVTGAKALPPGVPCCSIVSVDSVNRVATARVTATGQTFNVKGDKLKTLKPGSPVYADFTKKQVSVDPQELPCCSIVGFSDGGKPAPGFSPVDGAK